MPHDIDINAAASMTKKFRDGGSSTIKGGSFDRDIFDRILAQNGCQRLRYYFALDAISKMTIVIVGVDGSGNDMLNLIGEFATPCPDVCGVNNKLNTD